MDFYDLSKQIRNTRKNKKISQQSMANDLRISRATISNFEAGNSADIGLKKVIQILDYLNLEIQVKEKSAFPTFEDLLNER